MGRVDRRRQTAAADPSKLDSIGSCELRTNVGSTPPTSSRTASAGLGRVRDAPRCTRRWCSSDRLREAGVDRPCSEPAARERLAAIDLRALRARDRRAIVAARERRWGAIEQVLRDDGRPGRSGPRRLFDLPRRRSRTSVAHRARTPPGCPSRRSTAIAGAMHRARVSRRALRRRQPPGPDHDVEQVTFDGVADPPVESRSIRRTRPTRTSMIARRRPGVLPSSATGTHGSSMSPARLMMPVS